MQHTTAVIMLYDMVVTGPKSAKMCKEESSPHDVLCGRHQSEPCSVSGGEVGRALYLPLYLHLCS